MSKMVVTSSYLFSFLAASSSDSLSLLPFYLWFVVFIVVSSSPGNTLFFRLQCWILHGEILRLMRTCRSKNLEAETDLLPFLMSL
ncbi:hypothetical protein AKJ16_DCAP01937 [Drosera capensis]